MYGCVQDYKQKLKDRITDRKKFVQDRYESAWYPYTAETLEKKMNQLDDIVAEVNAVTEKSITTHDDQGVPLHVTLCNKIDNVDIW